MAKIEKVKFKNLGQRQVFKMTLKPILGWAIGGIFALGTLSAIIQLKLIAAIGTGFIGYMWTPWFDKYTIKNNNTILSGWVKFWIMFVGLAVLSYGGFYR